MTIIVLIVGISLLILIHEMGHFFAAKWAGLLVEEFGIGFPPRLWSKKYGETVYSINALPFGGFVKIYGEQYHEGDKDDPKLRKRSFAHQKIWVRTLIISAGVIMNFVLGWLLLSGVYLVGSDASALIVTDIAPESPAAEAGIQAGDILIDFRSTTELQEFVENAKGEPTEFAIQRGSEQISLTLTPRSEIPEGQGRMGIVFTESDFPKHSFPQNFVSAFRDSALIMWQIVKVLFSLVISIFTGGELLRDVVGPVGIFQVANQTASFGFVWLVRLIALISLNLAVLNIFPFPALDGGRLFFLLVEKIKGSPISAQREAVVNTVGFFVLIALMIAVTVKDVIGLL
jgi:regulator of sigma E protease